MVGHRLSSLKDYYSGYDHHKIEKKKIIEKRFQNYSDSCIYIYIFLIPQWFINKIKCHVDSHDV